VAEIAGPAASKIATAPGSVQDTSELLDIFAHIIGILLDEPHGFIAIGAFRLRRDLVRGMIVSMMRVVCVVHELPILAPAHRGALTAAAQRQGR
jgi:hypothetical protein